MSVIEGLKITRTEIPAKYVLSLVWQGDTLVDWVNGGSTFHLDGTVQSPSVLWGYTFDAACATPDGRFAVIYQRYGTKALLLREGKLLRELNRSYYEADVYEYPVCIWNTVDGRTLLAHCPVDYCRLDIEDADSGVRLTNDETRKPKDFFHSRLAVSPDGNRLLSAGWFWQPWGAVAYYEIATALRDPKHLDSVAGAAFGSEEGSACWQTAGRVLVGGTDQREPKRAEDAALGPRVQALGVAIYDVGSRKYLRSIDVKRIPGTMMPVGETHVVCFYDHPRLVSLESGEVVFEWGDLDTGKQECYSLEPTPLPPLASDPKSFRFAVFGNEKITVIRIDPSA